MFCDAKAIINLIWLGFTLSSENLSSLLYGKAKLQIEEFVVNLFFFRHE